MTIIYIIVFGMIIWIVSTPNIDGFPKKYRFRQCTGKYWKSEFPNNDKEDIREFLILFTEAFAFPKDKKLHFKPSDKIYDIYRALYPSKWTPDSLEVETLANDIENKYYIHFDELWNEKLTLGELFSRVKTPYERH